jgi:hypothetical protein
MMDWKELAMERLGPILGEYPTIFLEGLMKTMKIFT